MIERVKTGIPGFDKIVGGGIPKRNIVLLSGGPDSLIPPRTGTPLRNSFCCFQFLRFGGGLC